MQSVALEPKGDPWQQFYLVGGCGKFIVWVYTYLTLTLHYIIIDVVIFKKLPR